MLQLVPHYHVEMLKNNLKTNQYALFNAIEDGQLEKALRLLNDIPSRSIWISGVYLLLNKWDLEQSVINKFIAIMQQQEQLHEAEQMALTQICVSVMNIDMIMILHKHNLDGWQVLSPKIHAYLRKSIDPRVPQLFINYMKENIELLYSHEQAYEEDFVWTLHDYKQFYEKLPRIDHPYMQVIQISTYIRMLDIEKVPCPISPETIPIKETIKLQSILKRLMKTPHTECLELLIFCFIELGLFQIVMQNCCTYNLNHIRQSFIKHAKISPIVDIQVFKQLDAMEPFDSEIRKLIFQNNPQLYEDIDDFTDEQNVLGLMHHFSQLENQQEIIKKLALHNTSITLKAIWVLHLDGTDVNLQSEHKDYFTVKNFKWLNVFEYITYTPNPEHLIEALRVTAICIWTNREIRLDEFEAKQFLMNVRQGLSEKIFELLFGIATGQFQVCENITVRVPYFLEILVILLFEKNVQKSIKEYYLQLLIQITQNLENVLLIMRSQLVERLIIFLRVEDSMQQYIIQILINCIKVRFSVDYLQAIAQSMSPYQSLITIPFMNNPERQMNYKKIAGILGVPKEAIECGSVDTFSELIMNKDLFVHNSTLLLDCLNKVVSNQNDQYYYFMGHESGIIAKGKIQMEIVNNTFSVILQFRGQIADSTLLHLGNQDMSLSIEQESIGLLVIRYKQGTVKTAKYTLKANDNFVVINFQNNKMFQVNINGIDVLARQSDQFDNLVMATLSFICVGAKLSENDSLTESFRGEMRLLYILDQPVNGEDMYQLEKKSEKSSIVFSQLLRIQLKGRILSYLNTSSQKQDFSFDGLLHQDNQIVNESCQFLLVRGRSKKQSTISKFMDKFLQRKNSTMSDISFTAAKNVLFLESSTLLDVMKSYGNLDILFFPLHILSDQRIVISVLQLLNTIASKYGDDHSIQNYLRSDSQYRGIKVLGYLLTVHMKNYGCPIELAKLILNFYQSLLQCQIIQVLKNDCMCIYHEFEYWQYCSYDILLFLYSTLFEQLQQSTEYFIYFKEQIHTLYYILQIQLIEYEENKGKKQTHKKIRQRIIQSIIYLMYEPFFQVSFNDDQILPIQMIIRDKKITSADKLMILKNEIQLLVNYISLKQITDLITILGFIVRKPQQTLLLELLTDVRQTFVSRESILDVMQTQFAMKMENEDTLLQIIFKIVYGITVEMLTTNTIDDSLLGPMVEILVKVQIHQINYEFKLLEIQSQKNMQQQQKMKEYTNIKSLFNKMNILLFENFVGGTQTFQVLINLSQMVLKQELGLEKEVLDLFLPHFSEFNEPTKDLVIEFFLQTSTYSIFMSKLCDHKELMNFIRCLITLEKGQTLTNYIVLHHIENIDFSAKKILRTFHQVQQQNNMFMKVILTILLLQNNNPNKQNQKSLTALIDLFMLLPTTLTLNQDMILHDPELFVKVFDEYLIYLEKQDVMFTYYPDTEFAGFYEYDPIPFFGNLQSEIMKKYIYSNGGVMGVVLFILFYSLELLISKKEAKSLLLIWKKLVTQKQQSSNQLTQQALLENQQIIGLQMKIKKIKIKSQKSSFMQKIKVRLGEYQQNQYDKYFQDIHLFHVLKFQLLSQQYSHSEQLYDIFTEIKFKSDNFVNFQSLWYIVEQKNVIRNTDIQYIFDQPNLEQLSSQITVEEINNRAYQLITQFNQQNQQIQSAIQMNGKLSNDAKRFLDQVNKVNSALKYLELFKDSDLIKRALTFMKLYSYRQLQFCQELSILLNIYGMQAQGEIMEQSSIQVQQNDFTKIATSLSNQYRQEFKQIILKYENEQLIKQLIIQYKVKMHYKQNTHKRGLWYFMNVGDAHLYEKLNQENYDTFLELLGKERYSINSYEDSMRRKMFLKVFAKQKKKYEHIQLLKNITLVFPDLFPQQQTNKESQRFLAELITQRGFYRGKIRITNEYLMFENFGMDAQECEVQYKFQKDSLKKEEKQKLIPLSSIKEVFPRHYLAQPTAIEIFTTTNKTYLFNLFNNQQIVMKQLSQYSVVIVNPSEAFKKSGIIEKWRRGDITNFQYLVEVNKYGGRTYNDLNQYPILPWVIANYFDYDPNNKDHYRKLDIPIGAINPKRLENFLERFKQATPEDMNMYFIYGTHYSHSAIVMSFLMRMEPFASLHQELQSGRFDKADRLFHSLESQWHSVTQSSSDVKELIPEFYYFPEFLKNKNKFDLGQLQSGTVVSDVTLPDYVTTRTPEEMIFLNRLALESDYVSQNLHNWIDLIFGYKSGLNAQKYNNLFHRLTYSSYVQQLLSQTEDEVLKEQYITQVYYYGQTPQQLFKKEHPAKQQKVSEFNPQLQLKQITLMINKNNTIEQLLSNDKYLVVITSDCEAFVYNVEHRITSHKIPKDFTNQEIKQLQFSQNNQFLLFDDSLVVAGYVDNSVKVYSLKDLKLTCSVLYHTKVVTCLGQSNTHLLCGSMDTRISVWEWTLQHEPSFILYGHQDELSIILVNSILQIIVSYDVKGDILIHTIKGVFLKLIETTVQNSNYLRIHPSGYILMAKQNQLYVYTLQGELYVKSELMDMIITVHVIFEHSPEIIITTYDGQIFITSLMMLRRAEFILKKYKLEDMDMKMETNQLKKVKDMNGKGTEFLTSPITCCQYIPLITHRVLLIGYQNGQVISLYEQPKQTSLL